MNGIRDTWRVAGLVGVVSLVGLLGLSACSSEDGPAASEAAARVDELGLDGALNEFSRLCASGKLEEAVALADALRSRAQAAYAPGRVRNLAERWTSPQWMVKADRLAVGMGLAQPSQATRLAENLDAHLHWALGAARAMSGAVESAEEDFSVVRSKGGSDQRLLGMYGLGWLDLDLAEQLYRNIPEVTGASQNAMSPGFQPPAQGAEEQPDPLPLARAAYQQAMEHFLERLRADWEDESTRANIELVQRRLRHLDEIEDERKQDEGTDRSEENPEEDQQEQDDSQESSGEEGAPSEDEQEQDPQESSEDSEEEQEGSEQDSDAENDEEAGEQDQEADGEESEQEQEIHLTEEEMKRLLETMQQHNKEGEELREMLKRQGRKSTERDW